MTPDEANLVYWKLLLTCRQAAVCTKKGRHLAKAFVTVRRGAVRGELVISSMKADVITGGIAHTLEFLNSSNECIFALPFTEGIGGKYGIQMDGRSARVGHSISVSEVRIPLRGFELHE